MSSSEQHRFGLSTCWNGGRHGSNPAALLDEHERLGFRRLEAYSLHTPTQLAELAPPGPRARLRDHQPPRALPDRRQRAGLPGALGRLARLDQSDGSAARRRHGEEDDRRRERVRRAGHRDPPRDHGGPVAAPCAGQRHDAATGGTARPTCSWWSSRSASARRASRPHLEAALLSIRALGEHAVGSSVRLGVEARDQYQEIPSLDEMGTVLDACAGLPVGYWHDAGHGAKLEYFGFLEHEEYLRRYARPDDRDARPRHAGRPRSPRAGPGRDGLRDAGEVRQAGHDPDAGAARRTCWRSTSRRASNGC